MLIFKSCPRCKGNVMIDRDYYGWYEQCIQCGYLCDLENTVEVRQQQTETDKWIAIMSERKEEVSNG